MRNVLLFLLFLTACSNESVQVPQSQSLNINITETSDYQLLQVFGNESASSTLTVGFGSSEIPNLKFKGDAYIFGADKKYTMLTIGYDKNYYYFGIDHFVKIFAKILKNPTNGQIDNGFIYSFLEIDNDFANSWKVESSDYIFYIPQTDEGAVLFAQSKNKTGDVYLTKK